METIPSLGLDLPDRYIIQTLHNTIENSADWYNDVNNFNLTNKRLKNEQILQGRHLQDHVLYRHQTPYIDNEIYVGIDAIKAYVTAQAPRSEVYPSGDSLENKQYAKDLEAYQHAYADKFKIPMKLEGVVHDMEAKYVAYLHLYWDPFYGKNGEIITTVVDANHVIVDKNAKRGENPRFICVVMKATLEELVARYPKKEAEILKLYKVQRKGSSNMSAEVAYRKVWFTYYDKKNRPQEGLAVYMRNIVLEKTKDPNWLQPSEGENFLEMPMKPWIPFNIDNNGQHWYDKTSPVEQAIPQQEILNKLGRQIVDNLATANGFKVIDSKFMTKDDVQNFTGDPNQSMVGKVPEGKSIDDVIKQLEPQIVSEQLIKQLEDCRNTIQNILGTPDQFVGSDQDQTKTASEALMIKNQASGRQDKRVRAIDYGMDQFFNFLAQMMAVWYDDKHYATINGGDGSFDRIEMHKSKIETGMTVKVQSGTTLPFDKARQEAVAQNAAELGLLAPYDYYRLMHMENPQKLFDNLVKWKSSPEELVQDNANDQSDSDAIVDYTELMAGKKVKQRDDVDADYINQFRKLMITDKFMRAKVSVQNKVIAFVREAANSLALRNELDELSSPPPPPVPPQVLATGAMPPAPAPMPGMPQAPGAPAGTPPMPAAPAPGGMPLQAPGSPIQGIMQAQQPIPGQGTPLGQTPPPPAPSAPPLNPSQPQVTGGTGQITPF